MTLAVTGAMSGGYGGRFGKQLAGLSLGAFLGGIISSGLASEGGWVVGGAAAGMILGATGQPRRRLERTLIGGAMGWLMGGFEEMIFLQVALSQLLSP
jgi:hypothetical protein